jgi:PHD/YefM family antitoxin component YafN of YafNO toxin-antitoxin module
MVGVREQGTEHRLPADALRAPLTRSVRRACVNMKATHEKPSIVMRGGKPAAVILDIGEYREMLERLEDIDDLKALEAMRRKSLKFRPLDDLLKECGRDA